MLKVSKEGAWLLFLGVGGGGREFLATQVIRYCLRRIRLWTLPSKDRERAFAS